MKKATFLLLTLTPFLSQAQQIQNSPKALCKLDSISTPKEHLGAVGSGRQTASQSVSPTLGYVPVTFPRDPAEVNFVEEHTILGQIIEPILDSDKNGSLAAGIAESWQFDKTGTSVTLNIKKGRVFSNGKEILSEDVVYSIDRHLNHPKSQSSQFLKDIKSIKALDERKIEIQLHKKNPAILKALTREQLGILPKGWKFDPSSTEPFLGSGPYRAIKKEGKWFLVENEKFNGTNPARIKSFELVFYENIDFKIPAGKIPDIIPDLSERALKTVTENENFLKDKYVIQPKLSFTQTSFWVYPTSSLHKNEQNRFVVVKALDEAIRAYGKEKKFDLSTGLIPVGVQGYLSERPPIKDVTNSKNISIKIAYLPGVFGEFIASKETKRIFASYKIDLSVIEFNPQTISTLPEQKPDIVTGSWAGGFNDPVGFLGLLNILLGMQFSEYLQKYSLNLDAAATEENWSVRADKFRSITRDVVNLGVNIPGWKTNTYFVSKPNIIEDELHIRYTPRFSNIKFK